MYKGILEIHHIAIHVPNIFLINAGNIGKQNIIFDFCLALVK